ncbi:MAG TPA: histone deacetylase [Polyangiaceae bacterium]|nr:histone deacetylase [Polyangiaceae bacterium]
MTQDVNTNRHLAEKLKRMTQVAVLDDALFLEHEAPPEHPERAERLVAVREGLNRAGTFLRLEARDASDEELGRVHDPGYIESLGHLAGRSGYLDSDTYLSPRTIAAARRAAGSAVGLVEVLSRGTTRFGFALPRPPGHHALADRAMGFCLLNNVAVAAAHARVLGHERVLVLDWDVHHGNGTEAIFYADPSVLFISLHQFPNYPGTGAATDHGAGEGRGSSVNLPLPAGADDGVYSAAFERIVLPVIEQFAPSLALVSCGFDAHARDPLAGMRLSASGYAAMTRSLLLTLPKACPLGLVLEGGYDLEALRDSSEAVARVLLGSSATPERSESSSSSPSPAHSAALAAVAQAQSPFWKLT